MRLLGAKIGGSLSMNGAKLHNPDGIALNADGLEVARNWYAGDGFEATGIVAVPAAKIGRVAMGGAKLSNAKGPAFVADAIDVGLGMSCGSAEAYCALVTQINAVLRGGRGRLHRRLPPGR